MSNSLQFHGLQHPGFPVFDYFPDSLLKLMSIESVMPSSVVLFSSCSQSFPALLFFFFFFSEFALCIRWPKYWSFSFSISSSNEYLGLISFRMDCFDLLAIQGILKSLLQYRNLKLSVLQLSVFFMVRFSHSHMTTG